MFFTKYPHASNFTFADAIDPKGCFLMAGGKRFRFKAEAFGEGVYRVSIGSPAVWKPTRRIVMLDAGIPCLGLEGLRIEKGGFSILGEGAKPLLRTAADGIGFSGQASMFQFEVAADARFFGMGEKTFGRLELSGLRAKFWNTDVWGDFHFAQWLEHPTDPPYASVPYLIVKQDGVYVGLLLDNPYPTFMETPGRPGGQEVFVEWQRTSPRLILGSEGGEPTLWIIVGPTLPELTRKLQMLVGTTPLPPLWALGYHQSRWGYAGEADLMALDRKFSQLGIPCDSLWLDIDYMDGYRVFTVDETHFPSGMPHAAKQLEGRRIVAILDPGVKREKGYEPFDDGIQKDVFCRNAEGKPFVGMVWPGETVFPDLTLAKGQRWWSAKVGRLAKQGFGGFWLDMNDPSTGPVDPSGMRFNSGRDPHEAHHNHYALGMQKASFEGLRAAYPSRRPFLLSRSAFTGASRYSAVWTGDNLSNRFYLKMAIPTSLNLALSGIPFNGPDIGGFGGDTNESLMLDWMKACFLFPFCRNHTSKDTRAQEPWAFSRRALSILRHYIRLRYKLLPYLYQLFIRQEEAGEAILRPLNYDFEGQFEDVGDEFMVGPSLLQAPFLEEGQPRLRVVLPGSEPWFDASMGRWVEPGARTVRRSALPTPLFVRAGSLIPMRSGLPKDNKTDLRRIELHLFVPPIWRGSFDFEYFADDGETLAYRKGKRSVLRGTIANAKHSLSIQFSQATDGFGAIKPVFVIHGSRRRVRLNGCQAKLEPITVRLSGEPLRAWRMRS